jgi:hypothetical protein
MRLMMSPMKMLRNWQPLQLIKLLLRLDLCRLNFLDASIEVSLAPGYPTLEFAASGGVLNPKRE